MELSNVFARLLMCCFPLPFATSVADLHRRLFSPNQEPVKTMPQVSNDAQGSSQEGLNAPNGFPPQGTSAISTKEPRAGAGVTFAHQDDLPRLPIPDLEVTSSRYLDALKPLQSAREHEDTEAAVKDFVRKDGPELQDRLRKYATGKSSYIEEFCMCLLARKSYIVHQSMTRDAPIG